MRTWKRFARMRAGWLSVLVAAALSGCFVPEFSYDGEWPGSGGASGNSGGNGPDSGGTGGGDADGGGDSGGTDTGGGANTGGEGPGTGGTSDTGGTGGDGSGGDGSGGDGSGGDGSGGDGSGGDGSGGMTGETHVFLLLGQHNMWGVPEAEAADKVTNPRVEVLTLVACAAHGVDEWETAQPPLHGCLGNPGSAPGVGPGDSFGRAMAEAFPNDTILLVPNAVGPGDNAIEFLVKGTPNYTSLIARAQLAQERGTIRGILFHHGESDNSMLAWLTAVEELVDDLRVDLDLGLVPFLAGQMPVDGCCNDHNGLINQLDDEIQEAYVILAGDLSAPDNYNFDLGSHRTLGERYATQMIDLMTP